MPSFPDAFPMDVKCSRADPFNTSRRYVPLLEEYAYQPNTAAMVESFDTVRDLPVRDIPKGATGVGPVDWPAEAPGLRNASSEFYNRCDEVAVDLFRALARVCCMDDTEEVREHARDVTEAGQRSVAEPREQTECVELAAGDEQRVGAGVE